MAQHVPHLSFGFVFAMPEGLIVDIWTLPRQEVPLDVLAKSLVELAVWTKVSSGLLGQKPPVLLLEMGMSLCGGEIDACRFLMLGFSAQAPRGLVRRHTRRMVRCYP